MKTVAIIAEYNPFHNGHLYQLNRAKELTDADYIISFMSGNFLQRGVPAMWDKFTRAKMAVSSGVDLVLELPFVYATGSAYDFAMGAICTLNKLNTIDYLCFGAETDDLNTMLTLAHIIIEEPSAYAKVLQGALSVGNSYPAAREEALITYIENTNLSINQATARAILSLPNNTLALEYLCALLRTNSKIKPLLIKRIASDYHDEDLKECTSSANAIRNTLLNTNEVSSCSMQVPETVLSIIESTINSQAPITTELLTPILQGVRLSSNCTNSICDFDADLYSRFNKISLQATYEELILALTTKNKTIGRISRALIHYMLGYTNNDRALFHENDYAFYANLLAFNKKASSLLKHINQNGTINIITKKADYLNNMPDDKQKIALAMWNYDMKASELYNILVYNKFNVKLPNDYMQSPIIIDNV